jgi:hypothetical protein
MVLMAIALPDKLTSSSHIGPVGSVGVEPGHFGKRFAGEIGVFARDLLVGHPLGQAGHNERHGEARTAYGGRLPLAARPLNDSIRLIERDRLRAIRHALFFLDKCRGTGPRRS